jgi:hypothetical protein
LAEEVAEVVEEVAEVVEEVAEEEIEVAEEEEPSDEFKILPVCVGMFPQDKIDPMHLALYRQNIQSFLERVECVNGQPSPAHWISTTELCAKFSGI